MTRPVSHYLIYRWAALLAFGSLFPFGIHAASVRGQLELGVDAADSGYDSWVRSGLGKLPNDRSGLAGRMTLRADEGVSDFVGAVVAEASSRRDQSAGVQEIWVGWNPIPQSAWRSRVKAGAFFPTISLETGYDSIGWSAVRTLSSSAINSWIGEELRIKGAEWSLLRRGPLAGSSHSFGATVGAFGGNDPAGTLLAWRGWDVGGSVATLTQTYRLSDLPVYRTGGAIPIQTRDVHLFREVDHRTGHYESLQYSFGSRLEISAMHYDNRADPLRIDQRQYGWHTRFDHLAARLGLPKDWELFGQALRGRTIMGANAVSMDFSSWYLLACHPLGRGLVTARYDAFDATDKDMFPWDANGETGHAWTLAYRRPWPHSLQWITEVLVIDSTRSERAVLGARPRQIERSLRSAVRWRF